MCFENDKGEKCQLLGFDSLHTPFLITISISCLAQGLARVLLINQVFTDSFCERVVALKGTFRLDIQGSYKILLTIFKK